MSAQVVEMRPRAILACEPRAVGNSLLVRARQHRVRVDHMKLQKLVYFVHGWSLVLMGQSLMSERPSTWEHGPCFATLHRELRLTGREPVSFMTDYDVSSDSWVVPIPDANNAQVTDLLDQVWRTHGHFTALQLATLAHPEGGAWWQAKAERWPFLRDEDVRAEFQAKLDRAKAAG